MRGKSIGELAVARYLDAHCTFYVRFIVSKPTCTRLSATLEVTGSRSSVGDILRDYFLDSIPSPAQKDLKFVRVRAQVCMGNFYGPLHIASNIAIIIIYYENRARSTNHNTTIITPKACRT